MDTRALKQFAQDARRQLREQVAARLAQVQRTDSVEIREQEKAVEELERQIRVASPEAVIDAAAYTWFNRFCALRFMDVNHYTRLGIVSPVEGYTQPEILIPKSINRLRLQGAGSRYVHGGAALQEVVVPVIRIHKKRSSDIVQVEVDILRSPSSTISTGQLSVALYQDQPMSAKRQARKLRAGIYTQSGELISDRHDLIFDFKSENAREREVPVRFVLSREADQANEQPVFLKLEELVPDTTHYREYRSVRYTLRRSFTTDFDL